MGHGIEARYYQLSKQSLKELPLFGMAIRILASLFLIYYQQLLSLFLNFALLLHHARDGGLLFVDMCTCYDITGYDRYYRGEIASFPRY